MHFGGLYFVPKQISPFLPSRITFVHRDSRDARKLIMNVPFNRFCEIIALKVRIHIVSVRSFICGQISVAFHMYYKSFGWKRT